MERGQPDVREVELLPFNIGFIVELAGQAKALLGIGDDSPESGEEVLEVPGAQLFP
jgi:hypothetical protein